jgi:hypothetical protein
VGVNVGVGVDVGVGVAVGVALGRGVGVTVARIGEVDVGRLTWPTLGRLPSQAIRLVNTAHIANSRVHRIQFIRFNQPQF